MLQRALATRQITINAVHYVYMLDTRNLPLERVWSKVYRSAGCLYTPAVVEAVIRGEEDVSVVHNVGIIECLGHACHQIVYRLQGLDPFFVAFVYGSDLVGCET